MIWSALIVNIAFTSERPNKNMNWPPKTPQEIAAYLKYQKTEGLALPLIPIAVQINSKRIEIPEAIRDEISKENNFMKAMMPRIEQFLREEHGEDYFANSEFQCEWPKPIENIGWNACE